MNNRCTECDGIVNDGFYGHHLKLCKECFDLWCNGEMDLKSETIIKLRIQWIKQEIELARKFKANDSYGFEPMITFIKSEITKLEDIIGKFSREEKFPLID